MVAIVSPPTEIVCPDCGRVFTCAPGGGCWCESLPAVLPVPTGPARCLCPCQIERLADQRAAPTDEENSR